MTLQSLNAEGHLRQRQTFPPLGGDVWEVLFGATSASVRPLNVAEDARTNSKVVSSSA